ncbi:TadE family protein, partial [Microbacterium sp. AGC62]
YHAALADTTQEEGIERTQEVITRAIGASYAEDVRIGASGATGQETVDVRVRSTFPLLGLIGVPFAMEVEAHAPVEAFGDR